MESGSCCRGSGNGDYPGAGPFFGRLFLSLIFIIAGISKIFTYDSVVEMFQQTGISGAHFWVVVGLLFELVGGLLILIGWFTRVGSWILMIFLIPTTIIFHAFWIYSGAEMMLQFTIFMRNVAIFGGLILLLSYGPGRWSIDYCCCK